MRSDEKPSSQKRPETKHGHSQLDEESPRKNIFWSSVLIAFTVVTGIIGVLPFFGIPTIWSLHSHSVTASPIATLTPTPIPNMCGGGTNNSNPVGFTFCNYRGHKGLIHAVAWSPNGKRIASGGQDGTVQVLDATTGGNVITYRGHKGSVNALAWSPDGYRIASGGDDGTVQIWLSSDASPIDIVPRECCGPVTAIAWSPDGGTIAVGTQEGDVNIISAGGNNYYFMSNPDGDKVHTGAVTALVWSPYETLASASRDGVIIRGGPVLKPFPGPPDQFFEMNALAWSPDGKLIAYAFFDGGSAGIGNVDVNSVTQGNIVTEVFDLYAFPVPTSLAWACNSDYLAVGEAAGQVDIFEVSSKKIIYSYTNYAKAVNAVAWSPDGTKIASGSDDGSVKVWQAPTVRCST